MANVPLWGAGVRAYYERKFQRQLHAFRGVYDDFATAAAAAPAHKPIGYDNEHSGTMYREQMRRVYPGDYPALFWLRTFLPQLRSVLDFGGHVGVKLYAFSKYLDLPGDLDWVVCDVPAVCRAGERIASEQGERRLRFVTSVADAGAVDLFHAAGSLQYLDVSLATRLRELPQLPAKVIVNQLPVRDGDTVYTLQTIGHAYCPYRLQSRGELLAEMAALGYRVRDNWSNPEKNCFVYLSPEASLDHYEGFCFVREIEGRSP